LLSKWLDAASGVQPIRKGKVLKKLPANVNKNAIVSPLVKKTISQQKPNKITYLHTIISNLLGIVKP
jgi:hypothetical protein